MFQFPGLPLPAYGFSWEYARITTRRFSHSEIAGSKVGQHLPRAYRSRPRPSSALGAKASTVRSCSLDRKEHVVCRYGVFKVHASRRPQKRKPPCRAVSQNSAAFVCVKVDIVLGEPVIRTSWDRIKSVPLHQRAGSTSGVIAPESLERR